RNQPSSDILPTSCFEEDPQLFRIHRAGPFLDVHELRLSSNLGDCFRSGDEGVRNCNDGISLRDASRGEREPERVGAAADADTRTNVAECCELSLEAFHHWAANESCGL